MRQREIERLAKLKADKKELETKIKEIEKQLLAEGETAHETKYGVLKLSSRSNVNVPDNFELIRQSIITESVFIQNANMPVSKIKSIVGDGYMDLLASGVVIEKEPTYYYQLQAAKTNEKTNGKTNGK